MKIQTEKFYIHCLAARGYSIEDAINKLNTKINQFIENFDNNEHWKLATLTHSKVEIEQEGNYHSAVITLSGQMSMRIV